MLDIIGPIILVTACEAARVRFNGGIPRRLHDYLVETYPRLHFEVWLPGHGDLKPSKDQVQQLRDVTWYMELLISKFAWIHGWRHITVDFRNCKPLSYISQGRLADSWKFFCGLVDMIYVAETCGLTHEIFEFNLYPASLGEITAEASSCMIHKARDIIVQRNDKYNRSLLPKKLPENPDDMYLRMLVAWSS